MHSHDQATIIALDIEPYVVASHEAGITVRRLIRLILVEFCYTALQQLQEISSC